MRIGIRVQRTVLAWLAIVSAIPMIAIAPATAGPLLAASPYRDTVLADGPTAYWRLGESSGTTASDETGRYPGTYTNGPVPNQGDPLAGDSNTSVRFDGTDDWVRVAYNAALNPQQFTAEAWAHPTGGQGRYRSVIASRFYPNGWVLYATSGNFWAAWLKSGSGMLQLAGPAIQLNVWTHLVLTFDGTTARFYVNGAQVASASPTSYVPNGSRPLAIGQGEPGTGVWWPGYLDEAVVYNRALPADRVRAHYDAAGNPAPAPTATPTTAPIATATPTLAPAPTATATTAPGADCLGAPRYAEIRSANTTYNGMAVPRPDPAYRNWIEGFGPYYDRIDGAGCVGGTTEQILEWAAKKWGFADTRSPLGGPPLGRPNLAKAAAVQESDWYQRIRGDYEQCNQSWCWPRPGYFGLGYQTYGITGVKRTAWGGSWDMSHRSTAFAADWWAAGVRAYYDGAIPWASGSKGSLLRAVGAWFCGCDDGGGDAYAQRVFASESNREWAQSWFRDVQCSSNCVP